MTPDAATPRSPARRSSARVLLPSERGIDSAIFPCLVRFPFLLGNDRAELEQPRKVHPEEWTHPTRGKHGIRAEQRRRVLKVAGLDERPRKFDRDAAIRPERVMLL